MKILTTNFLTCAVKACKSSTASFPLHFRDASLERTEIDYNPLFIRNILPRLNWDALKGTAAELGLAAMVPELNPLDVNLSDEDNENNLKDAQGGGSEGMEVDDGAGKQTSLSTGTETEGEVQVDDQTLKQLHTLLLETGVVEGKLVCGNCGFEYPIKEGVGNFLLPAHLV